MIHIYSLIWFFIDIAHCLKTRVISGSGISEVKYADYTSAFPLFWNCNFFVHPQIAVSSAPAVTGVNRIPSGKIDRHHRIYNTLCILTNCKLF